MTEACEVIITAPDPTWLADLTRRLVEDRLCACGHNIPEIRSIYRWKGKIEETSEARVALHTRASLVPAIIERVKAEHPYEVPCVIATPIAEGNPDYLRWIEDETRTP
ncbi:periplasmic divalent cation tolerance protein [Nonomuraea polychroma]|uniref:Periplasmic divalent cation tolerance protein n=1 Tax=Nonomuraea polychroma TaxID=46176 RepID=A0A438MI20_9ACTN|nr:divalent-cation tolerance protein CutA [Nonomuraea polychroma]RVX45457.1 periplasmic divalent cation tolerance protein [Nonomuraea polychroma]